MTYGFKVKAEDGELEVADSYGDIPDGTHEISGHAGASPQDSSVQVTHKDESGEVIAAAHHHHAAE